jgi:hypothetical protein
MSVDALAGLTVVVVPQVSQGGGNTRPEARQQPNAANPNAANPQSNVNGPVASGVIELVEGTGIVGVPNEVPDTTNPSSELPESERQIQERTRQRQFGSGSAPRQFGSDTTPDNQ